MFVFAESDEGWRVGAGGASFLELYIRYFANEAASESLDCVAAFANEYAATIGFWNIADAFVCGFSGIERMGLTIELVLILRPLPSTSSGVDEHGLSEGVDGAGDRGGERSGSCGGGLDGQ